jgi:hypothetical protein
MKSEDRIALDAFPEDWKYYTLTFPVARYKHLSLDGIIEEMIFCACRAFCAGFGAACGKAANQ